MRVAGSGFQDHLVPAMCARHQARRGFLALTIFLLGASACAEPRRPLERGEVSAPGATAGSEAAFRAQLGRTWELARLGDQDVPASRAEASEVRPGRHPGPGSRPTLRFTSEPATEMTGDSASRWAGGWSFCNGYGMAYVLGPDGRLGFRHFQSTLVGCDGPDSLETRFFRGLANTRRFEMDATTLSLLAADGSRLVFVAARDSTGRPPIR